MGKDIIVDFAKHAMVPFLHEIEFVSSRHGSDPFRIFVTILPNLVDDVAAETINPFVEIEPDDVLHLFDDLWVLPIQVRLLRGENVKVPLPRFGDIGPSGAREIARPVIRGTFSSILAIHPDVIIVIRAILVLARLEPRVAIRGVIRDKIHDNSHAPFLRLGDQAVEILHRSIFRVDFVIIRDVVTDVELRAFVDRAQPKDIDPQILQVIEFGQDAGDIPDAIAV